MHHAKGNARDRGTDIISNYFPWHTSPYVTKLLSKLPISSRNTHSLAFVIPVVPLLTLRTSLLFAWCILWQPCSRKNELLSIFIGTMFADICVVTNAASTMTVLQVLCVPFCLRQMVRECVFIVIVNVISRLVRRLCCGYLISMQNSVSWGHLQFHVKMVGSGSTDSLADI